MARTNPAQLQLALLNGFDPKNPACADSGLGCGEVRLDRVPSAQMMLSPAKMPARLLPIAPFNAPTSSSLRAGADLLKSAVRFDAILAANDVMALAIRNPVFFIPAIFVAHCGMSFGSAFTRTIAVIIGGF